MSQEFNPPTPSSTSDDPLVGMSPLELFRAADDPPPPQGATPEMADVAAAFPNQEILGLIGQGGMGFVYKARQLDLDRLVALKILRPELGIDPAFSERFAREARVLAKLNHPNIVTIFEHGQAGPFFYLLMEHVDGVNLRQAMRAGRFTPEQALAIVPEICDALQAAHAQGIWHRDIKPENILLDADGKVKIVDFGIARIVGDPARDFTLTLTGAALGSAPYMAPEQHERPHEVDHRADIYSLGVVFYEMLTGELPLGRFPNPSERAAVHARIDSIVLQTLEKERELRQQTATEVKTDIQRAARDGGNAPVDPAPLPSRAESWFSRLPSLVRRSLVAWFGGMLLLGAGFWLQEEHISGAAFPLSLGGAAAALGLLGGLWSLFEMRREWLPATGRGLLTWTMLIPVLLATAWLGASVGFVSATEISLPYQYSVPMAFVATLVLAWPLRHFLHPGFRSTRGWIIAGGLLLTVALVGGKFFHGQWPFVDARLETDQFSSKGIDRTRDLESLENLRTAAGNLQKIYQIGGQASSGVLYMQAYRPGSGGPFSGPAIQSVAARLNQISDPRTGPWVIQSHGWIPAHRTKEHAFLVLPLATLSAIAALLMAGCSGRAGLSMLAFAVAGSVLANLTPARPSGINLVVGDISPLPLFTPEELPREIDFSTPENTASTIMLAAHRGQRDILREAITPKLAEKLDEKNEWDQFSQPGKAVSLNKVGVKLERDAERAFRMHNDPGDSYTMIGGQWKMDTPAYAGPEPLVPVRRTPQPQTPTVVTPKQNPVETVRLLNRYANEQNAEAFFAMSLPGFSSSGGTTPAQKMEPFYGEILMINELPQNYQMYTNVVVKLKRVDGSVKHSQFVLFMKENEWRLDMNAQPNYYAWTWIEFNPPQGNATAIIKNHLGENLFLPVKGNDHRFVIAGKDESSAGALMNANRVIEQLQKSLAPAGLASYLKVIVPAEEPAEPWMGDEPVMPTPPANDQ